MRNAIPAALVVALIVAGGVLGGIFGPGEWSGDDHYGGPLYDENVERAYGIR